MIGHRFLTGAAFFAALVPVAASAAVITRTYDYTATGFNGANNGTPPFATVTGSITLSFDDSATVLDQTGVTVNSSSIAYTGPVRYSYYSVDGTLALVSNGYTPSTSNYNGFALTIRNATAAGQLGGTMNYSVVGFNEVASTRNVVINPGAATAAVPEPATWALMLLGFSGMGYSLRRRTATMRIRFA